MTAAIAIPGHDIIGLVSNHPHGIRLSQLMEIVDERGIVAFKPRLFRLEQAAVLRCGVSDARHA